MYLNSNSMIIGHVTMLILIQYVASKSPIFVEMWKSEGYFFREQQSFIKE